jgi:7-cyano-7-deazaguanine synthase
MDAKKAVVLLSGGLDSTTCLAIAKDMGFECTRSPSTTASAQGRAPRAKEVGAALGVASHVVVAFDLRAWGGSALTSDKIDVPDYGSTEGIPPTYVPARNTIFLSFATAYAETLAARDIFIGVNSLDYSGYPDCRPAFVEAFERCATLGTKAADEGWSFKIHAPLQKLRKTEIIERGRKLGVDYGITHSCYNPRPDGAPCGRCDSCQLRAKAFAELGLKDPALK